MHASKVGPQYSDKMSAMKTATLVCVTAILAMYLPQLWTIVLVCVTVVLALYLPKLWAKTRPVITAGTVEPGFEPVAKLFRENFENGVECSTGGSAFSVYYKGSKVVDLWGGYADSEAGRPWREDTMTIVFSSTKGMAALCMAMLVDRGHLDYDKTVASYWPEFAQNGKENITVRTLLNHQAGLSYTKEKLTLAHLEEQNWDEMGKVLTESPPVWEPGTAHGYHSGTFGLYASQLLRRADPKHRTLGQFFKEEVAEPFDVDFFIGLPLELYHRAARAISSLNNWIMLLKGIQSPIFRQAIWSMITGKTDFPKIEERSETVEDGALMKPELLALEHPSAFGVGAARAMAKVYGILANGGQTLEGQKLLSGELIEKFTSEAKDDGSLDRSIGVHTVFNLGYFIEKYEGALLFGHPGAGGQHGVADPQRKVGMSYVTSYSSLFGLGDDPRFTPLRDLTYKCIKDSGL